MAAWYEDEEARWMISKVEKWVNKGKYRRAVKWVDRIMEDFEVSENEVWEVAGFEVEREDAVADN
tara:strand:+ start:16008 stop:16202 length:195 start_codon:yes stop_codon:yes gene_type:complete